MSALLRLDSSTTTTMPSAATAAPIPIPMPPAPAANSAAAAAPPVLSPAQSAAPAVTPAEIRERFTIALRLIMIEVASTLENVNDMSALRNEPIRTSLERAQVLLRCRIKINEIRIRICDMAGITKKDMLTIQRCLQRADDTISLVSRLLLPEAR